MKTSLTLKEILAVALPVMVGMFVQFTVTITDSAFMNRVSTVDFNAAGNGGMIYITFYMIAMGVSNGLQIMVARREGEGNREKAGILFNNALVFLAVFSLVLFLVLQLINHVFLFDFVSDTDTADSMQRFLNWRSAGFFFCVTGLAFQGFYSGIARTKIIMYSTSITAILNIILDYGFIFGNFGFPEMGIEGAAFASVISEATAFGFCFLYFAFDRKVLAYQLFKNIKINFSVLSDLLKISWPLMVQGFLSVGTWTVYFFFIEKMGREELEISQVIRNFYFFALIPVLGIGTATRTFVSNLIAKEKSHEVIPLVIKMILISLLGTLVFVHPNWLYPFYSVPVISTHAEVLNDTVFTLQIVTGAMLLMAFTMPLLNMISGSGDTRTSFYIEVISIVTYLVFAWLLTMPWRQEIWIVWSLEYLYFFVMACACIYYIRRGKWKNVKI